MFSRFPRDEYEDLDVRSRGGTPFPRDLQSAPGAIIFGSLAMLRRSPSCLVMDPEQQVLEEPVSIQGRWGMRQAHDAIVAHGSPFAVRCAISAVSSIAATQHFVLAPFA